MKDLKRNDVVANTTIFDKEDSRSKQNELLRALLSLNLELYNIYHNGRH